MGIEPFLVQPSLLESKLKYADGFYIATDPFSASSTSKKWDSPSWALDDIRQGENALRAARSANIPHVVLGSVSILALEKGFGVHKYKLVIETRAKELGLPYTILRPPFFMEGWI